MFSIYTEALIRFFSQLKWQGHALPVVYSPADRAHSAIKDWLKEKRGISSSKSDREVPVPYPFAAISKSPFLDDKELASIAHYRNFMQDRENGYGYVMRTPKAVTSDIDVNLFFKDTIQADYIEPQVHSLFPFGNIAWVTVDFEDPRWYKFPFQSFEYAKIFRNVQLQIDFNDFTDSSSYIDNGLKEKELKFTIGCTLHAHIPYQPVAVPMVHIVQTDIVEETSEEIISSASVQAEE